MPKIECFHCHRKWSLGDTTTNRCPGCDWVVEIYYDQAEAERVAEIYNTAPPPPTQKSGVASLIDINGYAVCFPDQGRLARIADQLVIRRQQ